jgi:hypothetical protein
MTPTVTLDATVELRQETVALSLSVTNATGDPIYIFSLVRDGSGEALPGRAYVTLAEEAGTAKVVLGEPPTPNQLDVDLEQSILPFAWPLVPDETWRGTILLPVPLHEWHAYAVYVDSPYPEDAIRVSVNRLDVLVEWIRQRDAFFADPSPVEGYWQADGHPAHRARVVLNLPAPIQALRRREPFDRF